MSLVIFWSARFERNAPDYYSDVSFFVRRQNVSEWFTFSTYSVHATCLARHLALNGRRPWEGPSGLVTNCFLPNLVQLTLF